MLTSKTVKNYLSNRINNPDVNIIAYIDSGLYHIGIVSHKVGKYIGDIYAEIEQKKISFDKLDSLAEEYLDREKTVSAIELQPSNKNIEFSYPLSSERVVHVSLAVSGLFFSIDIPYDTFTRDSSFISDMVENISSSVSSRASFLEIADTKNIKLKDRIYVIIKFISNNNEFNIIYNKSEHRFADSKEQHMCISKLSILGGKT